MKTLYAIVDISEGKFENTRGYRTTFPTLITNTEQNIALQINLSGEPFDIDSLDNLLFSLNETLIPSAVYIAITGFGVVDGWDSLSAGRVSFNVDLRNETLYELTSAQQSVPMYAELWGRSDDKNVLVFQNQLTVWNNILNFPGKCGIGTMVIDPSASTCPFKCY